MVDKIEFYNFLVLKIKKKAEKLGVELNEEISENFIITGGGIFDSMDFMHLIVEVEEKFSVEVDFSNSEPQYFTTIKGFIECIK